MEIIEKRTVKCICCMEEHKVSRVRFRDRMLFKGVPVEFMAESMYCENADEYYETEEQYSKNDLSMKDAYRRSQELLTSGEIISIRKKYGISQADLCSVLNWGEKTITRYEGHQVQDAAHDSILRKIDNDPEWYMTLLFGARERIGEAAYQKYKSTADALFEASRDSYLRKAIKAIYIRYSEKDEYNGFSALNIDKVVDIIRYFANSEAVRYLYKVKLMKLLWYADALSFKRNGQSITGLVYRALPMGAVPIGSDSIIDLKGINYEEVFFEEGSGYAFKPTRSKRYNYLNESEKDILNEVIKQFGDASKDEVVNAMHNETAYRKTKGKQLISFKYAKELTIE